MLVEWFMLLQICVCRRVHTRLLLLLARRVHAKKAPMRQIPRPCSYPRYVEGTWTTQHAYTCVQNTVIQRSTRSSTRSVNTLELLSNDHNADP